MTNDRGQGSEGRGQGSQVTPSPPHPVTPSPRHPVTPSPRRVAIVGGGLAGMAAAVALARRGCRVELFEAHNRLGGRAGSFRDPQVAHPVDYCQHVSMGCCTNLADFCRRIGAAECFRRDNRLHFFSPDGGRHDLAACWLPAPLHLVPALMRLRYLSLKERWGILRAMRQLAAVGSQLHSSTAGVAGVEPGEAEPQPRARREEGRGKREEGKGAPRSSLLSLLSPLSSLLSLPARLPGNILAADNDPRETMGTWLRRHGQSPRTIEQFWSVVLVSALGETVDRASPAAAAKVFLDGFLSSRRAYELEVPQVPLDEMFHRRAANWLRRHDVTLTLSTRIGRIDGHQRRATGVVLPDGTRRKFDCVIAAVPWRRVRSLFSEEMLSALPALAGVQDIHSAAITAVHLWFDRPIVQLPHAVLVGKLGQWVFHPAQSDLAERKQPAHYYQVVISASRELAGRSRDDVVAEIRAELESIWPVLHGRAARGARLLHRRVVTRTDAVFSMRPGVEHLRPAQQTPMENLVLAGDWTSTGWPATMEGAVRSGYLAAEAVLRQLGTEDRVLVPDLPRSRLTRMLTS